LQLVTLAAPQQIGDLLQTRGFGEMDRDAAIETPVLDQADCQSMTDQRLGAGRAISRGRRSRPTPFARYAFAAARHRTERSRPRLT
jgi:hypothetical protein